MNNNIKVFIQNEIKVPEQISLSKCMQHNIKSINMLEAYIQNITYCRCKMSLITFVQKNLNIIKTIHGKSHDKHLYKI